MTGLGDAPPPEGSKDEGFYPDPMGGKFARWWDGSQWTLRMGPKMSPGGAGEDSETPAGDAPTPAATDGGIRGVIRRRPLTACLVTGVIALLVGVGMGLSGNQTEVDDLNDQVSSLESELADAQQTARNLEGEVTAAQDQATQAQEVAAQQAKQLESRETEVAQREAQVSEAEQTLESSTIPDGTWQLGRDYEAGTYRAEGGGGCYWEKLTAPTGELGDIIANGGFGAHQTLVIDSPYFSTQDCGDWVKID